jgi:hypothetical protein
MEVNQPSDEVIKQLLKITGVLPDISHILFANFFFLENRILVYIKVHSKLSK